MPVAVRGLEQDRSRQVRRKRLEWLVEVSGCTDAGDGEGQVPGSRRSGRRGSRSAGATPGSCRAFVPDENDVVRERRAVESVDAEADGPGREALAIDPPGRIGILQNELGGVEIPGRRSRMASMRRERRRRR